MMNAGGGSYPEHHFKRVIPGDIESVRRRISDVLEDFNYVVLNENPIQAKRDRHKSIWLAATIECHIILTIALKPISAASTLATFNYAVEYLFTEGDCQTIEREADAIIALATAPSNRVICPACRAETSEAGRFCRVCGTPVARNNLPLEFEVLRLTSGASSAQIEINIGLVLALLTLVINSWLIFSSNPKAMTVGWVLFALGALASGFFLVMGMRRLHRTINPQPTAAEAAQADMMRGLSAHERAALPPRAPSVTEGTTRLIDQHKEVPASVRTAKDTDSLP